MGTRTLSRRSFLGTLGALNSLPASAKSDWFEAIPGSQSGIGWSHESAMSTQHFLPESLGPGVAVFDYDGDGWMDLFLVNSGPSDFFQPRTRLRNALYRNNRNGTFTDVTDRSGLGGGASFGMGVAVGDFDNDGHPDLFVTAYGRPTLYRNRGDGTFADVTAKSGIVAPPWTTSAVWFDYDGDGLLDLFLCGFVDYTASSQKLCIAERGGKPGYCIPRVFKAGSCRLYRNRGDGTFTDVSRETGIAARASKALGVVVTDINNDGRLDLFVANDTVENFLFLNRGGRFEDAGIASMVGLSESGWPRSGMGVDAGDINGDGLQDLFVANIDKERFSLYRNTGHGVFDDLSFSGELGRATYNLSGWGCKLADFDNDGILELFVANGHPDDMVAERNPKVAYKEPMLLFRQDNGQFRNISSQAGPAFSWPLSARGAAVGDLNNDGRLDIVVGVNGGSPVLLRNQVSTGNNWVGLSLRGVKANRDGVGSKITWQSGEVRRSKLKGAGGSYLSSHDPREILGLGRAGKADWVEIRWPAPSNRVERFVGLPINKYSLLEEGRGELVS